MQKPKHIIQQQSIEITFGEMEEAMGVQNLVAEMFYQKLQPRMEVLLDEIFGEGYHASIEKLEIDCGQLDTKHWEQDFVEEVMRQLKTQLLQVDKRKAGETEIEEEFLFFIKNGLLPWNGRVTKTTEFEQTLRINPYLLKRIKELITKEPLAADRLVLQCSEGFVKRIIAALAQEDKNELPHLLNMLPEIPIDKKVFATAILKAYASTGKKEAMLKFLVHISQNAKPDIIAAVQNELRGAEETKLFEDLPKKNPPQTEERGYSESIESLYVQNAGVILLHPFLQMLFEHTGFTAENKWLGTGLQQKAVLALQFLVTGNTHFEEFDLGLNKILCGIPLTGIVDTKIPVDEETQRECDVLLTSVIGHWSILQNTSIEGLRTTFLQRSGKLSKDDGGWHLRVEQKGVDVLLGHLPWGIGMIKLPWMDKMLTVEWA